MRKILVIASHPDDETYGVGGTIAKHIHDGDHVEVLILTDGVTARHNETEMQKNAAREACKILGVQQVHFARLPDQKLDGLPLLDVIKPIHALVKKLQPEIVYTHHGGDVNQDHRVTFKATLIAVRPVGNNPVKKVLCYEVASSTEWAPQLNNWAFLPNVFIDIEPYLNQKIKATEPYTNTHMTEVPPFPHPRSPEAVKIYAQQKGITVGFKAAEAFMLIRELS